MEATFGLIPMLILSIMAIVGILAYFFPSPLANQIKICNNAQ